MTAEERPHRGGRDRGRDLGWVVLAALMALYAVATAIGVGIALVDGDWFRAVRAALWLPFSYWVGVGAWRRTSWGAAR